MIFWALDNFTVSMVNVVQIQFLKLCQRLGCLCFIAVFRMLIGGVSTFGLYLAVCLAVTDESNARTKRY